MKIGTKGSETGTLNGFLDRGCSVTGELRFEDTLRLDGTFRGKIASVHTLVVGETGDFEGEIEVGTVSINGRVAGTVRAHERIEIHAGGRVAASLCAPVLVVEEGAVLEGEVSMMPERVAEAVSASSTGSDRAVVEDRRVVALAGGRRREDGGSRD